MSLNLVGNVADLDHDNEVGVSDLLLFCDDWLRQEVLLDTDLNRNGVVDMADFAIFVEQWMWSEIEHNIQIKNNVNLETGVVK